MQLLSEVLLFVEEKYLRGMDVDEPNGKSGSYGKYCTSGGEVLSADEILQLTLRSNERIIASKNEIVSTSSLLVHSLEKIWNFYRRGKRRNFI